MFRLEESEIILIVVAYLVLASIVFFKIISSAKQLTVQPTATEQIQRHIKFIVWISVLIVFVFVSGGFLAHQDTAWQQIARSGNELMLARVAIYAIFYPAYLIIGGGAWLYASSRLGAKVFDGKFKFALVCATLAPFMFLPSQDPDVMTLSSELHNVLFRSSYWAMMFIWITSTGYIVARQGLAIIEQMKRAGS